MSCRHLISVLILLHLLVFDEMSDIDQHSALLGFAAADVLIEGIKDLVDLNGESTGLGLALPLSNRLFPELGKVVAANRHGQNNFFKRFAQRAVFYQQFQMHFRLAPELGHALEKCPAVQADGPAEGFVCIEHGAKPERKQPQHFESFTDYVCMLQQSFLTQVSGGDVFADDHGKLATGIAKRLGVSDAFETFNGKRTTCTGITLKCLLFSNAVRVPCHEYASPSGKNIRAG